MNARPELCRIRIELPASAARKIEDNGFIVDDVVVSHEIDIAVQDDAGDELCDICMRSGVVANRTTEDGRVICVDCEDAMDESLDDCE